MLQPVAVGSKTLADYTHIVGRDLVEEIRELAEPLKGSRVVHVSATAFGGGVSEILYTLVPLMKDVGLDVEWQVIYGREEFFNATKLMHNALQGAPEDLSDEQWDTWRRYNEMNARELVGGWDVASSTTRSRRRCTRSCPRRRAAGCGAATSTCPRPTRTRSGQLLPYIATYPQSLFHVRDYVPGGHGRQRQHRAAGDRPAGAEEHGAVARGRRLRLRAVRHRRRPPADDPGLALRPLEGPARA